MLLFLIEFLFMRPFWFSRLGGCEMVYMVALDFMWELLLPARMLPLNSPALGDLYLDLGNLSVKLNIFLLSLIVFNIASCTLSPSVSAFRDPAVFSSGKNFLMSDSIIGKDNI